MATLKQKKAVKEVVENGGNVSKAMIKANYSPATAKTPQKLTESKGFKELLDEYLPDSDLTKVHKEALTANKVISARIVGKDANESTDDFIEVPDHQIRLKAVELGYKVKGKMVDQNMNINIKKTLKDDKETFGI